MLKETTSSDTTRDHAFGICIPAPRLEGIPEVFRPHIELGTRLQSEFVRLWNHRAQAWLNWPFHLIACMTAADVAQVQLDYIDDMRHHYAQFADGILRDALIEQDELEEEAATEQGNTDSTSGQLNAA